MFIMNQPMSKNLLKWIFIPVGLLLLLTVLIVPSVFANASKTPEIQSSSIHPTFAMLDANGENVLTSAAPVSTLKTCGQCHDTEFITTHAYHSDLGLTEYISDPSSLNTSNGLFGRWNPLAYRYLSQAGDERLDLSTAAWIMLYGDRIVGDGPASFSRERKPLTGLVPSTQNPETSYLNPETGKIEVWDWQKSGTMEMNCFLCHTESPNNEQRIAAIRSGDFGLANTATLFGSRIVALTDGVLTWNGAAFDENGELHKDFITIQDPTNENCAACHGVVHTEVDVPLVLEGCTWETGTTGQIITSQRVSDSGMNISDKDVQTRSWDIHAERGLMCTDCHYSPNNPAQAAQLTEESPDNLLYDPRTLEIGEYLEKPDHNITRGQSAQYNTASELKGSMRRCESCHDATQNHTDWLPYTEKHMRAVACETCHIPQLYAPAIQTYDWTVLKQDGNPATVCRGIEPGQSQSLVASSVAIPPTVSNLVTGYEPVLLDRENLNGSQILAPYNLITSFYWVYTDANGNKRPVRQLDLQAAFLTAGKYKSEILTAFDSNSDGILSSTELVIDSKLKEDTVKDRLIEQGLNDPRIEGMVEPYSLNHDVTLGSWSVRECQDCHRTDSRMNQSIKLADYAPGGVLPEFREGTNVLNSGQIQKGADGGLYYQPAPSKDDLYMFGHTRYGWLDGLGAGFFALTLVGVASHGTLRYFSGRRKTNSVKKTERKFIYQSYERFWHWLQTTVIVLLLFTGLIIHRPDIFGMFSFRGSVILHNVLAAILAVNAFLSLFYHLTTGQIRQYIPHPYGFFDDAIVQVKFYISGIFRSKPHPFEKTPDKKLNPLQQITYFGILNVLLPLQGLTGILMWSVQRWPEIAGWFGGLKGLAPIHTLIAWIFATFILGHVYLTTTGASPLESIRGMVTGYENVEVHD